MRVGFVGLGNQGAPIAQRIVQAGFDTVVWARRPESLADFRAGPATIAGTLGELGAGLDLLETCVFDAAGTREILFGPDGAARTMPRGSAIAVHSTVAPEEIIEIADEAQTYGLRVLDAPVSGGHYRAIEGQMVTMVGGEQDLFEACRPVFESFSARIIHLGPVGGGQRAKLLNNAMLTAHIGLANDALEVGARFGLDRAALAEVLVNGSGRSYGVEMLSGAGSLRDVANSQARPTLGKDVRLLAQVLDDFPGSAANLMSAALDTVRLFDELAEEPV
ncbi:MAG: 6-phosphogluconate dehydrogenase NAD-binding [Frankiales bacterium]|nr:6-phosphogluconate dehydrogenase NAD-binding [Frankiales bacterium]